MSAAKSDACRTILTGISAYLDGDADAAACEAIAAHCEACPSCGALVSGLRDTVGLCRQAGSAPLPEDVRRRALANVRRLLDADR